MMCAKLKGKQRIEITGLLQTILSDQQPSNQSALGEKNRISDS